MTGAKVRACIAVLLLSTGLVAQTPPRDVSPPPLAGTAAMSGTVLTGDSSAPVRGAWVTISSNDARIDGQLDTTGDDGRFEFIGLPAGRYTVSAFKPGYHRMNYGASRPMRSGTPIVVADAARIDGLTMRLFRGAAISGTVRDRRGRPLPDVPVSVLRIGYTGPGDRNIGFQSQGSNTTTDDRGAYRAWGLIPGEYLVMARPTVGVSQSSAGPAEFARLTVADVDRALARGVNTGAPEPARTPLAAEIRTDNWAPAFHPGTAIAESATTIVVTGDTERTGIDIVADAVPTTRVSGSVPMATQVPRGGVTVTLSATGELADMLTSSFLFRSQTMPVGLDGRFEFRNVAPGRYNVGVKTTVQQMPAAGTTPQPVQWAQSTIDVNGRPVDISLALQPAPTVTGRIVFEGTSPVPTDLTVLSLVLVPRPAARVINGPSGSVLKDGTFSIPGVTPGPYRLMPLLTTSWPAWTLKSAVAGGQNVLDGLTVSAGQTIDLTLTFADRHAELAGSLQDASGRPATDYFVVVFPVDPKLWRSQSRLVSRRPATDGQFSVRLLAGEYYVAALTDFQTEDMHTPSFLDGLTAFASRATIVDGQVTRLDLKIGK